MKKRHIHGEDVLVSRKSNRLRRKNEKWKKAFAFAVTAWTLGMASAVYAHPVLDAAGAGVAVTGTTDMSVTSTAENNLIKWVDFSIGSGEKVAFDANNYLNYVTGHAVSDIQGTLTGGGNIYLVNPNGILIGDNAVINVGNLYLSTKPLDTDALTSYDAGVTALSSAIIGNGDVINMGRLNADTIIVEGNNITFKNTADVTKDGNLVETGNGYDISGGTVHDSDAVSLTASDAKDAKGNYLYEIHIGSTTGGDLPAYSMNGTDKKYMYKLVSTAAELQNMNNNRSASYMLANDVDMKDFGNFTPIAPGDRGGCFTGRFDGLNHQIQNLTINSGADNVGLFGHVLGPGVIENVGLVGGSVTGTVTGTGTLSYVGGIVGRNDGGTIRNVYHTGTVTGTSYVGGIVGFNIDYTEQIGVETGADGKFKPIFGDTYLGTVERAYNTGSVTGTDSFAEVGGIAGHSKGVIREVFNTGAVSSTGSASEVGGIVGTMYTLGASVENAYNTGAITGAFYVGGIAGSFQGNLTNVYNTGTVTGTGNSVRAGGLAGDDEGALTNAYSISGVASALTGTDLTVNDTNVAELSAEDMKNPEKFAGFGFTQNTDGSYTGFTESGVWRIYENKTTPFLAAFPIPEPAAPTNPGTTDPTNPGTTDPTNPGTTDPTNPGTTDPTNPTNPTNPLNPTNPANPANPTNPTNPVNPTTNPTNPTNPVNPQPEPKLQDSIEKVTDNPSAAKEYTNVLVSLESGKPTANLPTEQEQNGLLPAQQTGNGQPAGNAQTNHLELAYNDINVPKSMNVEALTTMLNGKTPASLPNNAGVEAQPAATQGASQEGDEEDA